MSNLTGQPVYTKGIKRRRESSPEEIEDRKFLAWIRTLPSAKSGKTPCVAAHYRTAKNSGKSCKPLFSAIPLTDEEHRLQHQIGQYSFKPREWWGKQVSHYVKQWKMLNNG